MSDQQNKPSILINPAIKIKELTIEHDYPDDLQSYFVTSCAVQHQPGYFILSFFEAFPPVITGNEEEVAKQLESINSIKGKCVARLILPTTVMENYVKAVNENWQRYQQAMVDTEGEV